MLNDRAVMITAMILGFLLAVVLVGAVVILAWAGKDSSVVNTLVTGSMMGLAGAMAARLRAKGTKDDSAA